MTDKNTQIRLKNRPDSTPAVGDFALFHDDMPTAGEGQLLCRALYLSLDPYMRGQISGRHISGAIHPGNVMRGETVSEVVTSKHPDYSPGDLVMHQGGWQAFSVTSGAELSPVDKRITPLSLALGILGMPGLTAYAGMTYLADLKEGDRLVVSAASGAVGSMVGQIARQMGCEVVGIAGADEKCRWLVEEAGFMACINYKTQNLAEGLKETCSDGIDVYFDNVGGDTLEAAMWQLALGARVVLCGLMAQYNTDVIPPGPNPATIIKARATVRGLVVYDFFDKKQEFLDKIIPWVEGGRIKYREDVTEGLENAPAAFVRLMTGKNFGKTIIKF
ncbi:Putative oxidoreductase YncB [hydrothermal vent metagenome]|uniref:Oxidoreductase YncB n=1 Tax=hydrothermal vent metagenome TaxID=652676 RepID=A0A3B0RZI9_9ZZZZ